MYSDRVSTETTHAEPWTVGRLLNWTRDYLRSKGLDQPQLCAQLLLASALGCTRLELYVRFETVPSPEEVAAFRELVRRAAGGKPIAHLVGHKEFFSLDFAVTSDVLIPRPETETLVEVVLEIVRTRPSPVDRILDLCTGSGCVAAALAHQLPDVHVVATDVSPEALVVARDNMERLGLSERVTLCQGNLYDALPDETQAFPMIVGNPPYVKTSDLEGISADVAKHEPRIALDGGDDGLEAIRRIVGEGPRYLAAGGFLAIEIGYDQAEAVRDLFRQAGFDAIRSTRDALGHERVMQGQRS